MDISTEEKGHYLKEAAIVLAREGFQTVRTHTGRLRVLLDDAPLNAGYIPILAHVERYRSLHGKIPVIQSFWRNGVILQADTQSLFRGFGLLVQRQCRKLLSLGLIDLFSSDAHNCTSRPPEMFTCFNYINKKHGTDYAADLCCDNAIRLLRGEAVRKDFS